MVCSVIDVSYRDFLGWKDNVPHWREQCSAESTPWPEPLVSKRPLSICMVGSRFGKLVAALTGVGSTDDDDCCRCGAEIEAVGGEQ